MSYFDDTPPGDDWFPSEARPVGRPGPQPREETPEVPFVPVRCPKCGSAKPRTNRVEPSGIRYHICKSCGLRFTSREIDSFRV